MSVGATMRTEPLAQHHRVPAYDEDDIPVRRGDYVVAGADHRIAAEFPPVHAHIAAQVVDALRPGLRAARQRREQAECRGGAGIWKTAAGPGQDTAPLCR